MKLTFLTTATTKINFTSLLKTKSSSKWVKKKEGISSKRKQAKTKITKKNSSLKNTLPSTSKTLLKAIPT